FYSYPCYRYLGEEEDGVSKECRSQALLAKLQQKAKEKQKQTVTKQRQSLTGEQTEQQDTKKKKRSHRSQEPQPHKRRKLEAGLQLHSDNHDQPVRNRKEDTKSEKQKIKKKKDQSGLLLDKLTGHDQIYLNYFKLTSVSINPESICSQVHRVLPQWLAQPDLIQRDIKGNLVPIADITGLSAQLVNKLHNNGIPHFFPVQKEVIPAILESAQQGLLVGRGGYKPRDICVSAPTGSGKTLAFVLPVIQVLMERVVCEVRALAVLPTKELAQQVFRVFTTYAEGTSLRAVMLAGQKSFAAEQALLSEHRGGVRRSLADIVVATPGRLVDHINKNSSFCLEHLRFLIIDEADRMIDSMHQAWLAQVVKAAYRSGSGPVTTSIFGRTEPACVTAAR
uniref:ATP-dependent RNA helicase n=1 Tax=Mola mola TaxID=94237 RepID=A0A3Q3XAU8_MOLML